MNKFRLALGLGPERKVCTWTQFIESDLFKKLTKDEPHARHERLIYDDDQFKSHSFVLTLGLTQVGRYSIGLIHPSARYMRWEKSYREQILKKSGNEPAMFCIDSPRGAPTRHLRNLIVTPRLDDGTLHSLNCSLIKGHVINHD